MIKELIYILIILLGIPVGLFLARICKDEIKAWKKRLWILILACFIFGVAIFFTEVNYKIPVMITLGFIIAMFLSILFKKR